MGDSIKDDRILVSELVSRYLECTVCLEEYNDTNIPRQLPCQHTLCSDCLYKIPTRGGGITCPHCKHDHKLEGDASSYPRDLTKGDLMDFIRTKIICKCQKCEKVKAEYECLTCAKALCKLCKVQTHKHRSLQHHNIQCIIKKRNHTDQRCTKYGHDHGYLKYFCTGCFQILCAQCVFEEHRNEGLHGIVAIDKAYKKYKSQIEELLARMDLEISFIELQNKWIFIRLRYKKCHEQEIIQSFNDSHISGKLPADRVEECQKFCSHVCKGREEALRHRLKRSEKHFEQLKKFKTNISKINVESKDIHTTLPKMKNMQSVEQDFQNTLKNIKDIMSEEVETECCDVVTGRQHVQAAANDIALQGPELPTGFWIRRVKYAMTVRRRAGRRLGKLVLFTVIWVRVTENAPRTGPSVLFITLMACLVLWFFFLLHICIVCAPR